MRLRCCRSHYQSDERPYHHGDLRRAIVKAALEILNETQSVEFSLRELARRAGVSHNVNPSTTQDIIGEYSKADRAQTLQAIAAAKAAFPK